MKRPDLTKEQLAQATIDLFQQIIKSLDKLGYHAAGSSHEIYGLISEEVVELMDAIKNNNIEEIKKELLDVATAAIYGYVSADNDYLMWPKKK